MTRNAIVRTTHTPSADLPVNTNWRTSGACTREDPELFFPIGTTGPSALQIEEAKAVCLHRCPVMATCRDWALETGQDHGVWGGLSETDRRSLKRRAARQRARDAV
ncbi:WhiB family transcriptional regulator [Streptomyces sp. NPDC056909]|uniref:WhiB family transcriptional regulator n=1 Tax=Streptomyces sp. NPDC056909 TaxID=3345963 RepID=UPI0036B78395